MVSTNERSLNSMPLQAFMKPSEWYIFKEEVDTIAKHTPDLLGVLAVGSLVQTFIPPAGFSVPRRNGSLGSAYESIRSPERRKVFPTNKSDLDLWLCVSDTEESRNARMKVELAGAALLEELASGTVKRGGLHWRNKKEAFFGNYYKQANLYPESFADHNSQGEPWMAQEFKTKLEESLIDGIPGFVDRINRFTNKHIPGDFLEIRAFPESLFHLRPDDNMISNGVQDRMPFPRIADDQWIGPDHASFVLYSSDKTTIYPFCAEGDILGNSINEYIMSKEKVDTKRSYGAFLIKPDAIERQQVAIIKEKIVEGISKFGGCIVAEKLFDCLTNEEVETMYPLLSGCDLDDAKKYLTSGKVIAMIIESPLSEHDTLLAINCIKGPRIGDRTEQRLTEGRITDGGIRDLLPLPGDEDKYQRLLPTIRRKRADPTLRFNPEEFEYYCRNLAHTPDNSVELQGFMKLVGVKLEN